MGGRDTTKKELPQANMRQFFRMRFPVCREKPLIVLGEDLEVALGVVTDGADFGGGGADDDVAAVGALPDGVAFFGEDHFVFDVLEELAVALFVMLLDGADHLEFLRDFLETLFTGFAGHPRIHIGPLEVLAVRGVGQIGFRAGHGAPVQILEPDFGVLLLIGRRLLEEVGDLDISVFLGLRRVVRVLVAGH